MLILAAALPGVALAHAKIVSTVPADGDFVTSPSTLALSFDNDVTLTGLELHVIAGVNDEGRTVEGDVVELEFDAGKVARSFNIEVKQPLPPGEYYLLWRCVATDSHFSTGEFFFTVVAD
ncbi:MAG: copper resistance protein CopC [Woeseiaceae bacterium]|nr:copper resistance protein CopC [Woeseiaceae bacterium]